MALQRRLEKLAGQENKTDGYVELLKELFETGAEANLKTLVEHLAQQNPVSVRPAYKQLVDLVKAKRCAGNGKPYVGFLEAAITTLSGVGHQALDETINMLRFNLAKMYQFECEDDDENFIKAARHLGKMSLDNAPALLKVKAWVRCAQLYVADHCFREAEMFLGKLANILKFGKEAKAINDKYKRRYMSANAAVLDNNQKFHQAANEYYRLSTVLPDEEERKSKLTLGLKCVLLAPGSSMLPVYFKDERCAAVPGFNLVEKIFLQRFIEKKDWEEFESTLAEHQTRKSKEGWTLLEKAVIDNNLLAASNVYTNISMSNLGIVLGVSAEKAEEISSTMISAGRLKGTIDQNKGTLQFLPFDYNELSAWDTHVGIACNSVNRIFDRLVELHPQWVEKQF